jgi:DNA repair protein RecN (Recombination protein N)
MLQYLKIQNLALLAEVTLELEGGFHAVTGETGAGKSVLLGALALLSGSKADKTHIRQGEDECHLEAVLFFPEEHRVHQALEEWGIPPCEEGALLLQRQLSRRKAGRISVNGKLVTQAILQQLGELWIDFHGPGEPQKLFRQETQQVLLDRFGELEDEVGQYQRLYQDWRAALREVNRVQSEDRLSDQELKELKREVQMLESLDCEEEAIAQMEEEFSRWQKSSELQQHTYGIETGLSDNNGVLQGLRKVLQLARELTELDSRREEWEKRVNAAMIDLEDLATDVRYSKSDYEWEEESAIQLQEKMALWLKVKRRYGPDVSDVLARLQKMRAQVELQEDIEGILVRKQHEADQLREQVLRCGKKLAEQRETAARNLEKSVNPLLLKLGFKNARFLVKSEPLDEPQSQGVALSRFYFSANPGQEPLQLDRIASSGELARVMLALKTLLAQVDDTPVLVFDEVDANVGGEIGAVVGSQLANISGGRQVFCITHLPQVAAQGAWHWLVEKIAGEDATEIRIVELTKTGRQSTERIEELARMLGDRNSSSARSHARALLE